MGMMFKTGIIEWIKFDFHFDKKEEFIYTNICRVAKKA